MAIPANNLSADQKQSENGEKKYTILFVDDEREILSALVRIFRKEPYRILTAQSAAKAWQLLKEKTVHVIVSDLRMPHFSGAKLLEKAKTVFPDVMRIMLTGYADIDSVMEAVNQGAVYKFITKPWNDQDLKLSIRLALVQHDLQAENRRLKAAQQQQIKNIDKLSKFINKSGLPKVMLKHKILKKKDLEKAQAVQKDTGEIFTSVLVKLGVMQEEQVASILKDYLKIETLELDGVNIPVSMTSLVPKEVCVNNVLIPIKKAGNSLTVAMADPTDTMKIEALKFLTGLTIEPVAAFQKQILDKIGDIYELLERPDNEPVALVDIEVQDSIVIVIAKEEENPDIADLFIGSSSPSPVQVVNAIVADALNQGASDVHIEPKSRYVMVRHRINGLLFDKMHIPLSFLNAIVSRIKVMAELDISERRRPQDGRITIQTSTRMVDVRLSTLPTVLGEKIVFRILDRNSPIKDIDELGMSDNQIELVTQMVQKPQGCLLVTGPTGSGKTSTLYSLIQRTATIHKNYSTIEDPVEYFMDKAEQVMIKEKIGLTFPLVLRALLRQDPDTIMLGEIRDFETAEVAFHAALTGHTVLSTVHTNSCIATITRLLDMGVQSHVISASLNGVIAQRLVRRICPQCMVDESPSMKMKHLLGLEKGSPLKAKKGQGCAKCEQTGYKGRTGIYEVLNINGEIAVLLQQQTTEDELMRTAVLNGMQTLYDSGMEKINMGITTCEEVLRVLGPQNLLKFRCPFCDKMLTERFNFCPFCGKPSHPQCPKCHRLLEKEWQACPDCGTLVRNE